MMHLMWFATSPSRTDRMMGMAPHTLASKPRSTRFSAAA
jgi:hypothetical protein